MSHSRDGNLPREDQDAFGSMQGGDHVGQDSSLITIIDIDGDQSCTSQKINHGGFSADRGDDRSVHMNRVELFIS